MSAALDSNPNFRLEVDRSFRLALSCSADILRTLDEGRARAGAFLESVKPKKVKGKVPSTSTSARDDTGSNMPTVAETPAATEVPDVSIKETPEATPANNEEAESSRDIVNTAQAALALMNASPAASSRAYLHGQVCRFFIAHTLRCNVPTGTHLTSGRVVSLCNRLRAQHGEEPFEKQTIRFGLMRLCRGGMVRTEGKRGKAVYWWDAGCAIVA